MSDRNLEIALRLKTKVGKAVQDLERVSKGVRGTGRAADSAKGHVNRLNAAIKKTGQAEPGVKRLAGAWRGVAVAAGAYLGIGMAKNLLMQADAQATLQQRIRTATKDTGDYNTVSRESLQIAVQTGTQLETTVALFQNLSRTRNELGATTADILTLTRTVQQLGVISGTQQANMRAGLIQFSQAMAADIVRAEEFNSIIENLPEVAVRIARGLGMSVGELRLAVVQGKVLSRDVFRVLLEQAEEVNKDFSKMEPTIARGGAALSTAVISWLGRFDQVIGFTSRIGYTLQWWADAIGDANSAQTEYNRLLERRVELEQALKDGGGLFETRPSHEIQAELDKVNAQLRKMSDERIASKKAEAVQAKKTGRLTRAELQLRATLERRVAKERLRLADLLAQRHKQAEQAKRREIRETLRTQKSANKAELASRKRALDEAVEAEKKYNDRIKQLRAERAATQRSIADQIRELERREMSPEQRQQDLEGDAAGKIRKMREALESGDTGAARRLGDDLRGLADRIDDLDKARAILVEVGKAMKEAADQEIAGAEKAKAAEAERIASLQQVIGVLTSDIATLEQQLQGLEKERVIELDSNIEQQIALAEQLEEVLDRIARKQSSTGSSGDNPDGFARGGMIPGYGGGDRRLILAEDGEFMVRKEAVRRYGAGLFHALNSMMGIPQFATGGEVAAAPSGEAAAQFHFHLGDRVASLFGPRDQARALTDMLEELSRG